MRIDKQMIIEEARAYIRDLDSVIFVASSNLDSSKSLQIRKSIRELGKDLVFKSFPQRILITAFKDISELTLSRFYDKHTILAGAKGKVEIAELIRTIVNYNAACNKGLPADKKIQYLKVMSGLVDGEFYNIDRAHILEKMVTASEIKGEIISMLQSPVSSVIGVINERVKELS